MYMATSCNNSLWPRFYLYKQVNTLLFSIICLLYPTLSFWDSLILKHKIIKLSLLHRILLVIVVQYICCTVELFFRFYNAAMNICVHISLCPCARVFVELAKWPESGLCTSTLSSCQCHLFFKVVFAIYIYISIIYKSYCFSISPPI